MIQQEYKLNCAAIDFSCVILINHQALKRHKACEKT